MTNSKLRNLTSDGSDLIDEFCTPQAKNDGSSNGKIETRKENQYFHIHCFKQIDLSITLCSTLYIKSYLDFQECFNDIVNHTTTKPINEDREAEEGKRDWESWNQQILLNR